MKLSAPILHHIAIIVSDLAKAKYLYGHVLGLHLDERPDLNFDGLFYQLGGGQQLHLMLLDNPDRSSARPDHGGRYRHIALRVPKLVDITNRLDSLGMRYTRSMSGRAAIFFYDDDGNAIELLQT